MLDYRSAKKNNPTTFAEDYKNREPFGVSHITNVFGIAVFQVWVDEETVLSAFHNGEEYEDFDTSQLFITESGSYFKRYGVKYNLGDFMTNPSRLFE